jgi:hypothetical protein
LDVLMGMEDWCKEITSPLDALKYDLVQHIAFGEFHLRPVEFVQVRDLDCLASWLPRFRGGIHLDVFLTVCTAVAVCTVLIVLTELYKSSFHSSHALLYHRHCQ